ncbi:hypothetical protein SprV_0100207300 [Sparganum proliferum]
MAFKCLNSELGSIPQGIHPDTRNLDLSNNKIEILHEDSFLGFRHLEILHLDDNRIFKITDRAFDALALTLEYLSLRRNRLSLRVPSNFPASALSKLKKLRGLDLSGNPLGTIVTEWFSPIGETLQMLHMSDLIGPVEIQKNAFAGLGLLEDFDLSNNEFSAFPENAFEGIRPEKLTALNLTHIPWVCDCQLLWLRHWLVKVHLPPYSKEKGITSTCVYPKEFSKMTLLDLPVTQFQCVPKLQAINTTAANIFAQSNTFLHVSAVAGETIQLQCMFLSQPKMLVSWYKNGVLLRPELKRITQETSKGSRFTTTLTIYDLQHGHDCGNYTCTTVNNRGIAKATFQLWVSDRHKDSKYLLDEAERPEEDPMIKNIVNDADNREKDMQNSWIFPLATIFIGLCVFCGATLLLVVLHYKYRIRCTHMSTHVPLCDADTYLESVEGRLAPQQHEKPETEILDVPKEINRFDFVKGCVMSSETQSSTVMPPRPKQTRTYMPEVDAQVSLHSSTASSNRLFSPVGLKMLDPQNSPRTTHRQINHNSILYGNYNVSPPSLLPPKTEGSDKQFISTAVVSEISSFQRNFGCEKSKEVCRPVVRTFAPFVSYENIDNDDSDSISGRQFHKESYAGGGSSESSVSTDEACPVHGSRKHGMDKEPSEDEHFQSNWCPVHSAIDEPKESLKRTWSTASRQGEMAGSRFYDVQHFRRNGLSSSTGEITRQELRKVVDLKTAIPKYRWSTLQFSTRGPQILSDTKKIGNKLYAKAES